MKLCLLYRKMLTGRAGSLRAAHQSSALFLSDKER